MTNFGRELGAYLESIGMSKYRLAKLSGVADSMLSMTVAGTAKVGPVTIKKLAAVEGMPSLRTMIEWKLVDDYGPEISHRNALPFMTPDDAIKAVQKTLTERKKGKRDKK
jgi:transcriptional regulator with XRE-family HTH domain